MCSAPPALVALADSDYTSSFMRKSKFRPYEVDSKTPAFLEGLSRLGESDNSEDSKACMEKFVCALYSQSLDSVDNLATFRLDDPDFHLTKQKELMPACSHLAKPLCTKNLREQNLLQKCERQPTKKDHQPISPTNYG